VDDTVESAFLMVIDCIITSRIMQIYNSVVWYNSHAVFVMLVNIWLLLMWFTAAVCSIDSFIGHLCLCYVTCCKLYQSWMDWLSHYVSNW